MAGGECRSTGWLVALHRAKLASRASTPERQGAREGAPRARAPGGAQGERSPAPTPYPRGALRGDLRVRAAQMGSVPLRPRPQAYATVTAKPSSPARLLKVGAVVLISGAALLLFGAIGAFYFWKGSDNHVSPGGCAGRGGALDPEARGVVGSPLSCACSPLGGARALGRAGGHWAAGRPSRPSICFPLASRAPSAFCLPTPLR